VKNIRKMRLNRMPKVSEINLGTDCVDSARPDFLEETAEPTQCANGHWTTQTDLDKQGLCSLCPHDGLFDNLEDEDE